MFSLSLQLESSYPTILTAENAHSGSVPGSPIPFYPILSVAFVAEELWRKSISVRSVRNPVPVFFPVHVHVHVPVPCPLLSLLHIYLFIRLFVSFARSQRCIVLLLQRSGSWDGAPWRAEWRTPAQSTVERPHTNSTRRSNQIHPIHSSSSIHIHPMFPPICLCSIHTAQHSTAHWVTILLCFSPESSVTSPARFPIHIQDIPIPLLPGLFPNRHIIFNQSEYLL